MITQSHDSHHNSERLRIRTEFAIMEYTERKRVPSYAMGNAQSISIISSHNSSSSGSPSTIAALHSSAEYGKERKAILPFPSAQRLRSCLLGPLAFPFLLIQQLYNVRSALTTLENHYTHQIAQETARPRYHRGKRLVHVAVLGELWGMRMRMEMMRW